MPFKDNDISKIYYSIGEVSAMFGVNPSLLRFYEKEFEILKPKKNKKGDRNFTNDDIENLKVILHLIREKGYTLNGAKEHMKHNMSSTKDQQRVIGALENLKKFLIEVRDEL